MFQNAGVKWDIFMKLEWEWKKVKGETHGSQYVSLMTISMSGVLASDTYWHHSTERIIKPSS